MPGLGGFRHARPISFKTGWHNASFRGFADYMQTPEFSEHLDKLIEPAKSERVAIICAEAVPWRCLAGMAAETTLCFGDHDSSGVGWYSEGERVLAIVEARRRSWESTVIAKRMDTLEDSVDDIRRNGSRRPQIRHVSSAAPSPKEEDSK